jgi:hypothetical protein
MLAYVLSLLKKLFNFPDLGDITAGISKPIRIQLIQIEKKLTIFLLVIIALQVMGFIAILSCLENGFHWKYLFKV